MRWLVMEKGNPIPFAGPYLLKVEAELLAQGLARIHGREFIAVGIPAVRFDRWTARMTPEGLDVQPEPQRPTVRERGILRFRTSKTGVYHFPAPSYLGALAIAGDKFGDPAQKGE